VGVGKAVGHKSIESVASVQAGVSGRVGGAREVFMHLSLGLRVVVRLFQ